MGEIMMRLLSAVGPSLIDENSCGDVMLCVAIGNAWGFKAATLCLYARSGNKTRYKNEAKK
jgi:hypothetical protein